MQDETTNSLSDDQKILQQKQKQETSGIQTKIPKFVLSTHEEEINRIFLDKGLCVRLLLIDDIYYVDIRRFYKNYPTKKGIKIPYKIFKSIIEYFSI